MTNNKIIVLDYLTYFNVKQLTVKEQEQLDKLWIQCKELSKPSNKNKETR